MRESTKRDDPPNHEPPRARPSDEETTLWRTEWPAWLLLLSMFGMGAATWSWAPERIPVHWNLAGEIDRYGGRFEGLFVVPIVALGVYLLLLLLPRIDPGRANYRRFAGAYGAIKSMVLAFLAIVYGLIHLEIRGVDVRMDVVVPMLLGGLMLILGNLMGKLRPNWFIGVRTPWTLSSKVSWIKTHRCAAWIFVVQGGGTIVVAALWPAWATAFVLVTLVAATAWLVGYSYVVWKADPEKVPPAGTHPDEPVGPHSP